MAQHIWTERANFQQDYQMAWSPYSYCTTSAGPASQSPRFIIGPLLINPCNFRLIVISISIGPCLLLSFTAFCKLPYHQTLVSGNESESFIAFRKLPVCCRSMNIKRQFLAMNPNRSSRLANRPFLLFSESFHGQPLPFHAPPSAPAFRRKCKRPRRFHEDGSDLADVLHSVFFIIVCVGVRFAVCRWVAGRRQAGVRACRGRH